MNQINRVAAPLRQQVLASLREDILSGEYPPGARLREVELCGRYAVSRTVIREALRQLESESLIRMIAGRGPEVAVLSKHEIVALYEVRAVLEGLAGELFARNASDDQAMQLRRHVQVMEETYVRGDLTSREATKAEFYRLLLLGGDNEVLSASLAGIHGRIGMFRRYAFVDDARVERSMEEVRIITHAAALARDPEAARSACVHHIRLAGRLAVLEYERRISAHDPTEATAGHGLATGS
ncbi:GntR family transcriptional regulator [Nakamurella leprariae]|uniref:GntR family transcriptional regulator n=1 Tax=Nakamurella leprariae TaxID=2803911 RepID=A0A939BWD6_9ACTN|nr:GntR family transcriptional regulator [Nakamurella leprariae]MBM9467438.1 GntR family transcriptional regulator [Nakamurella leprariae]